MVAHALPAVILDVDIVKILGGVIATAKLYT